ncbi:hypothetical protein FZEAL_10317 [Fusarium zealandicum]|uniref:Uncharacterized protein n=1 Tax=Fusarium zealandicum TaxID=1053134 RepID=A0A8H4XC56_9HYPO|nr:hypothetical protein FZEAL_10317 [Fusarium zealandicum]
MLFESVRFGFAKFVRAQPRFSSFYEPVVLLNALNFATRDTTPPASFDGTIDSQDPEQLFKAFVYKLGHVCDSEKGRGGATITSFCVLKDQERDGAAHFWFASNERTNRELEATAEYVRRLLGKVERSVQDQVGYRTAFRDVLGEVLWFNLPRVAYYLGKIREKASKCRSSCSENPNNEYRGVAAKLTELLTFVDFDTSRGAAKDQFVIRSSRALKQIEQLRDSPEGQLMIERARAGRMVGVPSEECWSDLQHMINRTIAYAESVRFMLSAKRNWPNLLDDFQVSFIDSSQRIPRPFRNKSTSAVGIVGRMTRKEKQIEIFKGFAQDLQRYDLDKLIMEVYKDQNFRPLVHSEVLLLDWLDKQGFLEPRCFFNEWMYIGASKPTCKLCRHYFLSHHSPNVGHRPSHGNLYLSWRFPDVLGSQGEVELNRRQIMVDRVLEKVRKEAFDIVRGKVSPSYKGDDSFTYSAALPGRSTVAGSVTDADDLASMVGHLDLSDRALDFDDGVGGAPLFV